MRMVWSSKHPCLPWTAATWRAVVLVASLSAGAAGCDEQLSEVAGPTPNLEPTFSSIQREIFESPAPQGCVNCHTSVGRVPAGGLSLLPDVSYNNLVNADSRAKPGAIRVIPGDPDTSYLVQKLEGASGLAGLRMPRNGPPFLTDGQMLIIRRWVQLGAKND